MTISTIKRQIMPILKRQGVIKAALFGSAARGEMKKRSDVDILVELPKKMSLLDVIGLMLDLEEKIGKKVDLVEYKAIKPILRNVILNEQKIIYEQKKS